MLMFGGVVCLFVFLCLVLVRGLCEVRRVLLYWSRCTTLEGVQFEVVLLVVA